MSSLIRTPLDYSSDSSHWLRTLDDAPHRVFLDSARPYSRAGRFDIISADPVDIFNYKPDSYGDNLTFSQDIDRYLRQAVSRFQSCADLPFCGGAIGVVGYELGESLILGRAADCASAPLFVGIYDWAVIVDHTEQRAELVMQPDCHSPYPQRLLAAAAAAATPAPALSAFRLRSAVASSLAYPAYRRAFQHLQDYIAAGDCYQVNLTREFSADYSGDPLSAYLSLRETAAAPYSVFFDLGHSQLLSLSPERFIAASPDGTLRTEPIKGTARRDLDPDTDRALADALVKSEKNRAENVMIVDLLRNDLSKNCQPGSIVADPLMALQTFNTVHHLVSTVSGQLKPGVTAMTAMLDSFPGGSITGAPKRRAMEIIAELEPHRRNLYCGSVFYVSANGQLDSNITIRSFVCENGRIRTWAGGGIVADSDVDAEFQETQDKIGKLLDSLQGPE